MYRVVFSGQVLDGFALAAVREAVAERLKLDAPQVERLFSGRTVVLKKAIGREAGAPYLQELRRLGMNARLEPLTEDQIGERPLATFKVVFWGKLLRGYDQSLVMRAVTRRLRVNPQQLVEMFAGGKVVLKRRVNAETGARYVTELARIGMLVELEVETETLQPAAGAYALQPVTLGPVDAQPSAAAAPGDEAFAGLLRTQLDMSKAMRTALVQADVLGEEAPVEEGVVPDFRPKGVPVAAMAAHAAIDTSAAPEPVRKDSQIKCPQCGRHQMPGPRCRTCGLELGVAGLPQAVPARTTPKAQRMDASAYGAVTTLMQGLRKAVAPTSAAPAGAGVPAWMFELRENLAQQQEAPSGIQRKHWIAISAVLMLFAFWIFAR